jgi:hypothetical protein
MGIVAESILTDRFLSCVYECKGKFDTELMLEEFKSLGCSETHYSDTKDPVVIQRIFFDLKSEKERPLGAEHWEDDITYHTVLYWKTCVLHCHPKLMKCRFEALTRYVSYYDLEDRNRGGEEDQWKKSGTYEVGEWKELAEKDFGFDEPYYSVPMSMSDWCVAREEERELVEWRASEQDSYSDASTKIIKSCDQEKVMKSLSCYYRFL